MMTSTTNSRRRSGKRGKPISRQRVGIKHGYRSGLEAKVADQITQAGLPVLFETDKVSYIVPQRGAKYTPDFKLPKKDGGFLYIETKGLWPVEARQKHLLIKDQWPDLDIRFVFSNQRAKLAAYCEKHGWKYAHRWIPDDWLAECLMPE
jgi:hypothetical protein